MELENFPLSAIFILFPHIFAFHPGNHAIAFFLSASDDHCHSTDLDAPGDNQQRLIGLQLLPDELHGLVHVHKVFPFHCLQLDPLLCH